MKFFSLISGCLLTLMLGQGAVVHAQQPPVRSDGFEGLGWVLKTKELKPLTGLADLDDED